MRRRHIAQVDEASLQTDVMRFMAIVAFCLIAILAMVRNIEAPPSELSSAEPSPTKPVQAEPLEVLFENADPIQPEPVKEPVLEPVKKPTPEPETPAMPAAEPLVAVPAPPPPPVRSEEVVDTEPQPFITSAPEADERSEESVAATETVAETNEEEGLTLRFASEADFLRLVARGKVAVYAFSDADFLELKSNFKFAKAAPPEQVYELEAATIPRQMRAALPRSANMTATEMKWAVGLPRRVQRQIHEWVNSVESGELLINRFEEVHHVALR